MVDAERLVDPGLFVGADAGIILHLALDGVGHPNRHGGRGADFESRDLASTPHYLTTRPFRSLFRRMHPAFVCDLTGERDLPWHRALRTHVGFSAP